MDEKLHRIRHSAAHVMAQAVLERFQEEGTVRYGVGPATEDGFYYDFDLPRPLNEDDLKWIEKRMRKILSRNLSFERQVVTEEEARAIFADDQYKIELIDGIVGGVGGFDGDVDVLNSGPVELTTYTHGDFTDLCAGPHVSSTNEIDPKAVKLLSVAGAYWRGDEHRPMMQRIYGTAFETVADLEHFIWQREEAARRDHRKLGHELELFHFEPTAPGMPYWLPNGLRILNTLLEFWREEHEERDYQETSSPLINEKALWETSGHWDHYRDNMFIIPVDEHRTFGVKPMNCPNAMVMYNLKTRSYRELPLRLSDCDVLHRNERSGTLHGLLRVQHIQQDDAHIFLEPDQVKDEYREIFDIAERFYSVFGLSYRLRLGTRPDSFVGEIETWDEAERVLREILDEHAGQDGYIVEEGDGAFYGPKIDILMADALGREWQMGTIQLDFQLPQRFGCRYSGRDGQLHTPVVVHRVIYGSFERFIGILIEHFAGRFPAWLSPIQVQIVPVTHTHSEHAQVLRKRFRKEGLRANVIETEGTLSSKVRLAQSHKSPYLVVLGDTEVETDTLAVRFHDGRRTTMAVSAFIEAAGANVSAKLLDPTQGFGLEEVTAESAETT